MWIVPFRDRISIVLHLTFKHFRSLSVLRTVYTHRSYARGKTFTGFAKIIWVSSVNLKTVFTCYRKQRILVHYGKGYKAARRYSSDLKLLHSLSPNGLGRLVSKLLRSVCTDNFFAHSSWRASLTRKLLCYLENCFAEVFLHFVCKRSVVHSVLFFCTFHFVSRWRDRCISFP